MKKKVVLLLALAMLCTSLTGCTDAEVEDLRKIEALGGESEVTNISMSVNDREAAVYAQVSNRTLLDLTLLEQVSDNDIQAVRNYMESIDAQLTGVIDPNEGVVDERYTDYLLMLFQRSPYYWQRSSMNVRGMDSASRSIIVDVTYEAIDFNKDVQQASFIPRGCESYDLQTKTRYDRWNSILKYKYDTLGWYNEYVQRNYYSYETPEEITYDYEGVPSNVDKNSDQYKKYVEMLDEFKVAFGDPEEIIKSQRNMGLTDYVYETGNQKTYSGLIDTDEEKLGGTMTVRFVLVPQYTLGINQGYSCQHMYLLGYSVSADPTEGREIFKEEGSSTIIDSVYNTIYRYFTCLDEDNYKGLYNLVDNFGSVDKHYEDYFQTSYRKHENFTLSLFSVAGTRIECGVTMSEKERAKGSNMTLPIYTNRYYITLELIDGTLKITNVTLLSSVLEGEPAINTDEVVTTGFNSSITLDSSSKQEIEKLISEFGALQLEGDVTSDKFSEVVDTSISNNQMNALKESLAVISGERKAVWLTSYLQGTSNYASVRCKEVVKMREGTLREYNTVYNFVYKGGKWIITGFEIQQSVILDSLDMSTKNALCVCVPGEVEEFTSQITDAGDTSEDTVDTSSVGEIITFEHTDPVLKDENFSVNEIYSYQITDADIIEYLSDSARLAELNRMLGGTYTTGADALSAMRSHEKYEVLSMGYKQLVALQKNYNNGLVTRQDYLSNTSVLLSDLIKEVQNSSTSSKGDDDSKVEQTDETDDSSVSETTPPVTTTAPPNTSEPPETTTSTTKTTTKVTTKTPKQGDDNSGSD